MVRQNGRFSAWLHRLALLTAWCVLATLVAGAEPVSAARLEPGDTTSMRWAMRTRLYFGMWSTHIRDLGRGLDANALVGIAYRGFFGATFINSYGDRSVCLGVQRSFSPPRSGFLTTSLGYRLGVITGYDERFFGIGDKMPALPFVQLVGAVDVRNLGMELGYAGIVASLSLNWRL